MSKNSAIEIFLRVRPTTRRSDKFHLIPQDSKAVFSQLRQMKKGEYVNNTRDEYNYCFNGVFPMETKQEEVFETVARDVLDNAFEGYNGTVFAYGQTGSGKTYTMTGGEKSYVERGIIPRSISYIFSEAARRADTDFAITISYLEIYNNDGYDLLSEDHSYKQLNDLPKVIPLQRGNGDLMLTGLTTHKVSKEEDALNLLFIGDTNRVVCETPMNDASTRSHCIFRIGIESCKHGSDVKTVSKIHLVDLSGSERPKKTGVNGKLFQEACAINSSLFFLEQVINSLQKKMNAGDSEDYHIPYRNSLMTMVLRDSLGGNCKTKMISTIHVEDDYIDESISTCNFSMRVAMIKNTVVRNEAVDPNVIIQKLKRENQELRAEISMLRGGQVKEELTGEDMVRCQKIAEEFLKSRDPTQNIVLSDPLMINQCFREMRSLYVARASTKSITQESTPKEAGSSKQDTEKITRLEEEVMKLKLILKQRETEIALFLNLINKKNSLTAQSETNRPQDMMNEPVKSSSIRDLREEEAKENMTFLRKTQEMKFPSIDNNGPIQPMVYSVAQDDGTYKEYKSKGREDLNRPTTPSDSGLKEASRNQMNPYGGSKMTQDWEKKKPTYEQSQKLQPESFAKGVNSSVQRPREAEEINKLLTVPLSVTKDMLMNRQECFEMFRKSYRKAEALNENIELLKQLKETGKAEAEVLKKGKEKLDRLKNSLEDIRKTQALKGIKQGGDWVRSPEEEALLSEIEAKQKEVRKVIDRMKNIKEEMTRVQLMHENSVEQVKRRMEKDFEKWMGIMLAENGLSLSTKGRPGDDTTAPSHLNDTRTMDNTSILSKANSIRDDKVRRDLEGFYKAKEELASNARKLGNPSLLK